MYSMGFGGTPPFSPPHGTGGCANICAPTHSVDHQNQPHQRSRACGIEGWFSGSACMRKHMHAFISTYSCSQLSAVCLRCEWAHQAHASMKAVAPTIGATMFSTKGS